MFYQVKLSSAIIHNISAREYQGPKLSHQGADNLETAKRSNV